MKTFSALSLLALRAAIVVGWIINIVKLIAAFAAASSVSTVVALDLLRLVGIFVFPLGAILGWFF